MTGNILQRLRTSAGNRLARHWRIDDLPSRLDRPLVSFSFDDFPRSAETTGARILTDAGYRGTYYVSGCFAGRTIDGLEHYRTDDLIDLARDGHEIGCHTFDHLRMPRSNRADVARSIARNREFVRSVLGPEYEMSSFAYPYGAVSLSRKWQAASLYPICRSIEPRVNAGLIDFAQIGALGLENRDLDLGRIAAALDEALERNGWVIFFTHDVSDRPTMFGCPTAAFSEVVRMVAERGIDVLPVKHASARARFG